MLLIFCFLDALYGRHPTAAAFHNLHSDASMVTPMTSSRGPEAYPLSHFASGFQTLPVRGAGKRRPYIGNTSSCVPMPTSTSLSCQHRASHTDAAMTDLEHSTDAAIDHVTSRYGVHGIDEMLTMTSLESSAISGIGTRMPMSCTSTELDFEWDAAGCRLHQMNGGQQSGTPSNVDAVNTVGYGKLKTNSIGRSLQDLPDSNV